MIKVAKYRERLGSSDKLFFFVVVVRGVLVLSSGWLASYVGQSEFKKMLILKCVPSHNSSARSVCKSLHTSCKP